MITGVRAGTSTVRATSVCRPNIWREVRITVVNPPPPPPPRQSGSEPGISGELLWISASWALNNVQSQQPVTSHSRVPNPIPRTTDISRRGFILRHPIISSEIGSVVEGRGNTNISTNSVRFSNAFGFNNNPACGSEVNALRHVIWMAIIANRYGMHIATLAGNSHEDRPNMLEGMTMPQILAKSFRTRGEAKDAADLLNNFIGRSIGSQSPSGSSQRYLVERSLRTFRDQGFFVVERRGGAYQLVIRRISSTRFTQSINILRTLDANGFPPGNQFHNTSDRYRY
ncbi:MAG: hypothetical protein FWC68_00530 [Oscillospiraceae bacterium]|nr:hypothetical protein [Oscillospiraceae bacterium]